LDLATQKRLVKEQRAGYDLLAKLDLEAARHATFEERLEAFNWILCTARELGIQTPAPDVRHIAERWRTLQERYEAAAR
jgi:hypothetical protein